MSQLVAHAERELRLAGLFDKDSDYEGILGQAVLELVKVFASQGHSGFSAGQTIRLFEQLASYRALTPVTSDPSEWMKIHDGLQSEPRPLWQSTRQSSCFSNDGGQTYWDIDANDGRAIKTSAPPRGAA